MAAGNSNCHDLAKTVDDIEATVEIRPGFVNDTYFLIMKGRKPHANTSVELKPVTYVRQPEYWQIDVMECSEGDILLPAIMPYAIDEEVSQVMGTKGLELHWANGEVQKIDKP